MMADSLNIRGLDAALGKLRALRGKEQIKAVRQALRKGANIVRKDAQARAKALDDPSTTQAIHKEIVVRQGRFRNGELSMRVGVRGGAKAYVDSARNRREGRVGRAYEGGGNVYHWRFLEFGTSKMAARPFMRPALEGNVEKVIDAFGGDLEASIDKIMAKAR